MIKPPDPAPSDPRPVLTVPVPREVYDHVARLAAAEDRSLAAQVRVLLVRALAEAP